MMTDGHGQLEEEAQHQEDTRRRTFESGQKKRNMYHETYSQPTDCRCISPPSRFLQGALYTFPE